MSSVDTLSGDRGDGTTPVPADVAFELKLSYVTTLAELAEAEQRNIAAAMGRRRPDWATLLDDRYLRDLHQAMFGSVWTWAGRYRTRELSIGVDPVTIAGEVRNLCADANVWIDHMVFASDEIALRFHHRLVQIHPFVNGNGRHSRHAADLLATALGQPPFGWGAGLDETTGELRSRYLQALRRLDRDRDDVGALVEFARG